MRWIVLGLAMIVGGCSSNVRDTKIANIDFSNASSVQSVAQKLDPAEREVFAAYIMSRQMAGTFGIKEVVAPDGKAPATVGQAIDLTKKEVAARKANQASESRKQDAKNALTDQWNKLVEEFNEMPYDASGALGARRQQLELQMERQKVKMKAGGVPTY